MIFTSDTNPAASHKFSGPRWTNTAHDDLKLPSGAAIGDVDNDALRAELTQLGIVGSQVDGRGVIVERYAAMLKKIHDDAGDFAVRQWLEEAKSFAEKK